MCAVMTPEQVAEHLQVSTDTVYRLIKDRQLAASQVGRQYRILREDLDKFLLVQNTRAEVREALFERHAEIGRRTLELYPDLTEDDVFKELEALDEERRQARLNHAHHP